ncbi:TetR/AcrR family transcriptional regulator [Novosphingobium sp. PASSN1]|uniref:TetR/AcrR family transcriptional regulator n=1 Tax=Novosphingobium sp. PASSN1 TaxID=2015561 RepID=UPI000BD19216|nr:TetR/AcrR family transcriptional regulator [Novosphingobium sp. PASSN1]OYU34509.1 MAG: hypothetical protein CFE35_14005 [Novosphingobium sp. PASSN1]
MTSASPATPIPDAKPDHRIEVARRRRETMRARIMAATMKVCSANPTVIPTIDEIIQTAEISRGAFYRYFSSSPEVIEAVGVELMNELADAIVSIYDTLTDPLQRACVGTFLVLGRAVHDPEWASFILRADLTIHNSRVIEYIRQDMKTGLEAGYFRIANVQWAAEFLMGMNLTGIRGLMVRPDEDIELYCHEAVRFVLRSLGVAEDEVSRVMAWGDQYLSAHGARANWWERGKADPEIAVKPPRKKPSARKIAT